MYLSKTHEQRLSQAEQRLAAKGERLPRPPGPFGLSATGIFRNGKTLFERVEAAEARLAQIFSSTTSGSGKPPESLAEIRDRERRPVSPVLRTSAPGLQARSQDFSIRDQFEAAASEKDPRKRALLFAEASAELARREKEKS